MDGKIVWLCEDTADYVEALQEIMDAHDELHLVQTFSSLEKMLRYAKKYHDTAAPDVLLLDINLPGKNGIDGIRELKAILPSTQIVMFSVNLDSDTIYKAFQEGASGYLPKESTADQIISGILEATDGGMLMPAQVASKVRHFFQAEKCPLTHRQLEILQLMAEGLAHKEIADTLCISHHTVDTHLQNIYTTLHVKSGTAAVTRAFRGKWFM